VQLARAAGFEYLHVPYQGAVPVLQDLLAGRIASSILPIDTPLPYIQSGTLRALATSRPQRGVFLPDVPTFREAGYPALESVDWRGIFVPANTPAKGIGNLNEAIQQALEANEVKAGLKRLSVEVDAISQVDFARLMKSEFKRWHSVVLASGFTPKD
jgi:tripartite-type tricarboxylate transporter receptor subunit TctC